MQNTQIVPEELRSLLITYSEQDQRQLLTRIMKLQVPFSKHNQFNQELHCILQSTFINLIQSHNIEDFQSLVQLLFAARSKCRFIKNWVILAFIDNLLETLDQRTINKIVAIMIDCYGKLGKLEAEDVFKLHKIINQCLRIIPNSDNSIIRGKLHCIMTKILKLGHESGLRKKQSKSTNQKKQKKSIDNQDFELHFKNSPNQSRAYITYWKICNQLDTNPSLVMLSVIDQSIDSQASVYSFELNFKSIVNYFRNKPLSAQYAEPVNEQDTNLCAVPHYFVKFSSRRQFRTLLMLRVIIYCRDFRLTLAKNSQSQPQDYKSSEMKQQAEQIISSIESLAISYMQQSQFAYNKIQKMLMSFYKNQEVWRESQQKRGFQDISQGRKLQLMPIDANQSLIMEPIKPKIPVYNFNKIDQSCRQKKLSLLQIKPEPSELLLNSRQLPILLTKPTIPSFSYYSSAASSYFDQFTNAVEQFESDQEYELLQWKAMRSLCRQNISGVEFLCEGKGANKFKLIQFVKWNGELFHAPRKRVKLMQETDVQQ